MIVQKKDQLLRIYGNRIHICVPFNYRFYFNEITNKFNINFKILNFTSKNYNFGTIYLLKYTNKIYNNRPL